jgi:Protein of unknown function (DUF3102)
MSEPAAVPATAEAHAKLINEAWQKTVPAIVETGQRIREARDELERGEFESMVKTKLNFGRRTAFYLMAIAEHPVLSKVHHGALLPPSWRTLADLARLDGEKLEAAIEDGTVHPKMERKDVAALLPPPKRRDDEETGAAETEGDGEMRTEAEADGEHQAMLYDQACLFLEQMTGETRRKFFAYIQKKYVNKDFPSRIGARRPDAPRDRQEGLDG